MIIKKHFHFLIIVIKNLQIRPDVIFFHFEMNF